MRRFRDLFAIGRRAAANSSARARRPRRGALGLEPLEDRVVLSTFLVTNLADSGDGSLRQAIVDSDGTPGPNEIDFAPGLSGTITLTSGQLTIANNAVTIVGPGADVLSVSGHHASRVFEVDAVQAALSGLTITNGSPASPQNGGGIFNGGTLTLNNAIVSGNYSAAIYNSSGYGYGGYGGGIHNGGTLTLNNTTVSGNSNTGSYGSGIYNSGTLVLTNAAVMDNDFEGNGGGAGSGIYNAYGGSAILNNSTVSGNHAAGDNYVLGGGISNGGTLTLNNSTVSGNSALGGGGISNGGTLTLNNCTVSGNSAGIGGGLFVSSGSPVLHNTLIAGNFNGATGTTRDDVSGHLDPGGDYNLIGDGTGMTGLSDGVNGNQVGSAAAPIDPRLGPLQDNGGPTLTRALLPGSPAIDAGNNAYATAFDQRGPGFPRIVNGTIDIGAFEVQATNPPPVLNDAGFEAPFVGTGSFGSFAYDPAGTPWSFAGYAGVAGNGSGFTAGNPGAPEGLQVGFVQMTGALSQAVAGWAAGTYQITFDAAQRANVQASRQDFRVLVDGAMVGTFTPAGTAYAAYATATFSVAAGAHRIAFQGLDSAGGDNTAFIDEVRIAFI
jgi:hypothetical protein